MSAIATQGQAERAELEAVLNSGIFSRAPSLANFLKYVCERYFDGESEGVKEYCIAVEALRRPIDFDQKKDAIVRVEAHRLRKRLADYYKTAGASHAIHIDIPNGQYSPRFIFVEQEQRTATTKAPLGPVPHPAQVVEPSIIDTRKIREFAPMLEAAMPDPAKKRTWRPALLSLAAPALALAVLTVVWPYVKTAQLPPREVWTGSFAEPVPNEFRMLAGYHGEPFADRQGRTWQPDAYYNGGLSVPLLNDRRYEGLPDPAFAKAQREGDFEYAIPVRQGSYEVHLYFIETQTGDPSDPNYRHLFHIFINGKMALDYFDLLADAGAPNRLTSRVFNDVAPAADGRIHLKFEQLGRKPVLAALEILFSTPGRVRPVRIVAARESVTDSAGELWLADQYAVGGMLVERKDSIRDNELKYLYAGEHYGNFAYHIPLPADKKYRVKLYFAETFFGSKLPFAAAPNPEGKRVFNVFCDGQTLLRNFDVTKEAGGPNKALVRTFENLEPNAQGKIVLEFVPVRNYAEVNAIEVTQME